MTFSLSLNSEPSGLNRALAGASRTVETSMERLASGKKINSASDDVAGFAISERMTTQIKGLNKAVQNINDGISLAAAVQATTKEVINIAQRIRELTVQGLSETNSTSDKAKIQTEIGALIAEIGKIGESSTFNDRNYHRETMYAVQTGVNDGDMLHFHTNYINPQALGQAIGNVNSYTTGSNATIKVGNSDWLNGAHKFAANDVIIFGKADPPNSAAGTTTYTVNVVLNNVDGSQTLTLGADLSTNDRENILSGNGAYALVVAGLEFPSGGGFTIIPSGGHKSLANLDITDPKKSLTALDTLDAAIRSLSRSSANMGTIENRLQFSISNLLSVVESTEAARSSIVDTDFAVESALLAKGMVLQQSAAAMLTQSRAQPDLILSLLRGG